MEIKMGGDIQSAIENMNLIEFSYEGGRRTVEPHCFGVSKAGNECLRAYQVGGYSSSGKMGWKLYDLSKMAELEVLNQTFEEPRADYQRNDKQMQTIYCQL